MEYNITNFKQLESDISFYKKIQNQYAIYGIKIKDYTCSRCSQNITCSHAFHINNTNGFCQLKMNKDNGIKE